MLITIGLFSNLKFVNFKHPQPIEKVIQHFLEHHLLAVDQEHKVALETGKFLMVKTICDNFKSFSGQQRPIVRRKLITSLMI